MEHWSEEQKRLHWLIVNLQAQQAKADIRIARLRESCQHDLQPLGEKGLQWCQICLQRIEPLIEPEAPKETKQES